VPCHQSALGFRGVSDIDFSSCTVPAYYTMSKYFKWIWSSGFGLGSSLRRVLFWIFERRFFMMEGHNGVE